MLKHSVRHASALVLGSTCLWVEAAHAQTASSAPASAAPAATAPAAASASSGVVAAQPVPAAAPAANAAPAPAPVATASVVAGASLVAPTAPSAAPVRENYFEAGVFGGLLFPSSSHALYQTSHEPFKSPVPELGARLAYFPLQFAGAELELAAGPAKTDSGSPGSFWGARAHVIGQLPLNGVTPFALLGLGRLGAGSNATGSDSDPSIHFGVGAKVPLDEFVGLRLDLRDNLTQKWEAGPGVQNAASQGSQVHHPEVLLGLTFTLDTHGTAKPPSAPPPANLDADHDGVEDSRDACPNEAGPAPTGCPDKDQDHDCVPIPVDQCPNESATTPNGCSDPDPDHDGVVGASDRCPREPETKNGYQDDDGCPDTLPAKVAKFSGVVAGIEFDTGLAVIRPASKGTLNEAVAVLKEYATLRVAISGHTDNVGERDKNLALSAARAESVKNYLVSQGINAGRIETRGVGPDQPIADNKDELGRQKNRRIEFKLLSQ